MGMTAARLRERRARGEISPKAPSTPTHIPFEQYQEEIISWRKKTSMLETRIAELEAELGLLKRPITKPPPPEPARAKRATKRTLQR